MPRLLVAVMAALGVIGGISAGVADAGGTLRVAAKEVPRPHAFTIAGWVRAGSRPGSVLAAVVNLDRRDGLSLRADRRVQFRLDVGRRRFTIVSPSPLASGERTHVALVATSSSLALFVGGQEVAREAFEPARRPVAFRIVKRVYEEGRVYRRALSAETIRELAGPAAPPAPPEVASMTPSSEAVRVPVSVQPSITFAQPIDPSLVTSEAIVLATADGTVVPAALSLDEVRLTVRIVPAQPLRPTRWHSVSAFGVTARFMTASEPQRIAVGESHSVALDAEGRVWTWGANTHGQLGREGSPASPGVVTGLPPIVSVAAGAWHTLALAADGRVFAWGNNLLGQIGSGDEATAVMLPELVASLPEAVTIAAGLFGSAALDGTGRSWVWGMVQGLGAPANHRVPLSVDGIADAVAIAAGVAHTLVLLPDGSLWAWGGNGQGEVGDGTRAATGAPVQVAGLTNAAGVAAGSFSSFALMEDGSVQAWGLVSGAGLPQLVPAPITGLSDVRALAADTNSYVAVTLNGGLLVGGATPPVTMPGPAEPWQVAASFERQLLLTRQAEAWTWTGAGAPVRVSAADLAWLSSRPVLSHASGTYNAALQLKVTSPVTGAVMRYSTDGSDPGEQHPQVANGGTIAIAANAILKVRAWESGRLPSDVVEASYTFQASKPVFSPQGGTYSTPRLVTISSSAGATIHYTLDGSQPDATSPVYTAPLHVATSQTIAAIALRPGWAASETAVHTYRLQLGMLPAPVISPASGTYESPVTVSISSPAGATVFYTLDGSMPSPASPVYQGPFAVAARTTVRARAIKADYEDSPTAAATYVFAAATPVMTPGEGTYSQPVTVQLSTATEGATIRYTLDGSEPSPGSPEYQEPIVVDAPATVRARAFHPVLEPSGTATTAFAFQAGATEAAPHGGIVGPGTQVTLAPVAGASVHFTLDGTTPTEASAMYVAPIALPGGLVTLMARAFRTGWQPGPVLTAQFTVNADVNPPVVTATVSPEPIAGAWHAGDVVVTFHCADEESVVTYCTPPQTVRGDGGGLEVRGIGRDAVGNVGFTRVRVNIDRTAPVVSVFDPLDEDVEAIGTSAVAVRGGVWDLSGISTMTCNGVTAVVAGRAFTCTVPVFNGPNTVRIVAVDLVGHSAMHEATVYVGDGPPPAGIRFTPARLTLLLGERRELALQDDGGRDIAAAEWQTTLPGIVSVTTEGGRLRIEATGAGRTEVMASVAGFSARASIEVLEAGAVPAAGSLLWGLDEGSPETPPRATVIPATPAPDDDPDEAPAMFYVNEAVSWFGDRLLKPTGRPVIVRAATATGIQLWVRQFNDETSIKHVTADEHGGLVIVWNQWFDAASGVFHTDRAQRLDGRTGRITWEYRPYPAAFLSEAAVHPDGRVFMVEQRIFGVSELVGMTLNGDDLHWPLPGGQFSRVDNGTGALTGGGARPARATQPLITDDGTVVVVAQRGFTREVVTSQFHPDEPTGLSVIVQAHLSASTSQALVLRLGDGGLVAHELDGEWNEFRPDEYYLLPDGQGGLLLGHRKGPHILRFDAGDELAASSMLLQEGDGYTYGTEYVLGDGAAYVLLHGASNNGLAHWSSAVAFDPGTLDRLAVLPLASQLPAPSHLRLQFALAGGGVYLSGPDGTSAHLTPLGGEAWAGWSDGPALLMGAAPPVAETEWASPAGTTQRTNVAFHPGYGVFAKTHRILRFGRHVSLRIVPRDQDYWVQRQPSLFANVDSEGRRYATLGAGPGDADTGAACDGSLRLVSAFNRPADVSAEPDLMEKLRYARATENALIDRLIDLDHNYDDDLPYCFVPPTEGHLYNSNSYISGLLRAADIRRPVTPGIFLVFFPGWAKPVPATEFAPQGEP